ncbi:hypothetical protein NMG60_11027812 [Bertholletia excelsa]
MPKKSSSKPSKRKPGAPAAEEEKTNSSLSKKPNEIDEIFAGKKRKKPETEKAEMAADNKVAKADDLKKKKKAKGSAEGGIMDPPSRPRKRTNDGLAIYTEEELAIGKADAGGTPFCPFDCSCCF